MFGVVGVFVFGVPSTAVLYVGAFGFPGLFPVLGAGVPNTALLYVGAFGFPGLLPVFAVGAFDTVISVGVLTPIVPARAPSSVKTCPVVMFTVPTTSPFSSVTVLTPFSSGSVILI